MKKITSGLITFTPVLAMIFVMLSACGRDDATISPVTDDAKHKITLSLNLPATAEMETRAEVVASAKENNILTLDLVVCNPSGGTIVDVISCTFTAKDGTNKQWEAEAEDVPKGTYDLVLIANASTEAGSLNKDDARSKLTALIKTKSDKWIIDATDESKSIPMWGEATGVNTSTTTTASFDMKRMLARIKVTNAASNFTLTDVYYYNYSRQGLIVPPTSTYTDTNPNTGSGSDKRLDYLTYSGAYIYVFEAPATQKPCIVVGGTYNSSKHYYRIDFGDINITRNISYVLNITSVSGDGSLTPDEAYELEPVNMSATITSWVDVAINETL
ncbi:DUF4906 domain-containing protein [Bacteroides sp. 519]|uniref:DUF4906 domain-containing protein n=1 Tax=Bacteroides sp. 519 TaxID=2302937 RepID=UPI0013D07124|nr:DUF4906 domain-containing protein [Bacteroides sp. 519]NDV60588.1 DUF4906 domain-containing protein [Bacteroides sp. 519]